MRLDLNRRPLALEDALLDKPAHLRTHGLSLYIDPAGKRSLFVINHPLNRGTEPELVEVFDEVEPGSSGTGRPSRAPSSIRRTTWPPSAPASSTWPTTRCWQGGLAAGLQQLGIGASPLTYFDGTTARVVLDDIASGGGINVSADGSTLYVSETSAQRLRVLERNPADGSVTEKARIAVPTSPDNVDVAADGSLWVTGHANTRQADPALHQRLAGTHPGAAGGPGQADGGAASRRDLPERRRADLRRQRGRDLRQEAADRLDHGPADPGLRDDLTLP